MNAYICRIKDDDSAMLVFANTAKEARRISYGYGWHEPFNGDWIYWTATRIKDLPDHLKALDTGSPQVIDSPPTCPRCELWGGHKVIKWDGEWVKCSLCYEEGEEVPNV